MYFPIRIAHSVPYRIMNHWKNQGGTELADHLLTAASELIHEIHRFKPEAIVPIPQHEERNLKRGHSSAFETARFFSTALKIPIKPLIRLLPHQTKKQSLLDAFERLQSPNPFDLDLRYTLPKRIMIVDDFITTGNTLSHAAHVILEHRKDAQIIAGCLGWKPLNVPRGQEFRFFGSGSGETERK